MERVVPHALSGWRTRNSAWGTTRSTRWGRIIIVAGLLFAGCATAPKFHVPVAGLPAAQQARAERNLRVFNAAWDLVNRKHFDPKFQGVDWEQAAATYAPRAAAARDEPELYAAIDEMLAQLHDSHTHVLTLVKIA